MKILHISKHCRLGHGNAHVAVDLACEQASRGHEVVYSSAGGEFIELLRASGVTTWDIRQEAKSPATLLGFLQFLRKTRRFAPDVIHAHMMGSAIFGFAAAKLNSAPLITTVHNSFDRHSYLMRIADAIVAVSQAERRALIERGFPAARTFTVLNGTIGSKREGFMKADESLEVFSPCVTAIAGLHQRKGVDSIIKAFSSAWRNFPEWNLYIVGDGPDRSLLTELAQSTAARKSIHFVGTRNRPSEILRSADIFVLASHADPCALVLSEARGAGCAVIGSRVGGTPEALDYGESGLLFAAGDVDELKSKLLELMSSRDALQNWRKRAANGAQRFSVSEVGEGYMGVYKLAQQFRDRNQSRPRHYAGGGRVG